MVDSRMRYFHKLTMIGEMPQPAQAILAAFPNIRTRDTGYNEGFEVVGYLPPAPWKDSDMRGKSVLIAGDRRLDHLCPQPQLGATLLLLGYRLDTIADEMEAKKLGFVRS